MLENTEGAIKNGQSSETDNIEYTRRRKTKQQHNAIGVRHHYTQTNTSNVNKTWAILKTNGGKDETEHHLNAEIATGTTTSYIIMYQRYLIKCSDML